VLLIPDNAARLPASSWYRRKVSEGTKDFMVYEFARRRVTLWKEGPPSRKGLRAHKTPFPLVMGHWKGAMLRVQVGSAPSSDGGGLPIIFIQYIPTAVPGAAVTALGLGLIPVIEGQLFPSVEIAEGDNPDGAGGEFRVTVRITGMIDVAGGVVADLPIDVILPVEGKDIDIAPGNPCGTRAFRNPLAHVLDNPRAVWDRVRREQSFPGNTGLPHP